MNNQQFIRELVLKSAQGDVAAFQELYQCTRQRAWFVALSITKNEHDAQDILQESYLKAYQSLSQLEKPEAFESWLGQITANKAKNYISRKKPDSFADYGDENAMNWQEETDTEFLPDKNLDQAEAKALVAALVSELPEDQRLVVLMRYYDDMEVAAVAAALKIPEGTVKSRLARARKKLAAMLQQAQSKGIQLHAAAPIPLLIYFIQLLGFEENPGDRLPPLIGLAAAGAASATATAAAAAGTASTTGAAAGTTGASVGGGLLIKGVAIAAAAAVAATGAVAGVYIYRGRTDAMPGMIPAITEPTAFSAPAIEPTTIIELEPGIETPTFDFNQPMSITPIERTLTQAATNRPATTSRTTTANTPPEVAAPTTTEPAATTAQATERTMRPTAARPTFTARETTTTTTTVMSATETIPTATTQPAPTDTQPTTTTTTTTTTATTTTTRRPYSELFQVNHNSILRYIGDEDEVVIPSVINGVTMRHLSQNAFAGTAVRRVVIPENFCCIRNRSFANMPYLEEIVIPACLSIIDAGAFEGSDNVVIITTAGSIAYHYAARHGIPVRLIP